jgi:phosphomannomutase
MQAKKVLALFDVDQTLTVARTEVTQDMTETLTKMRAAGVHFGIVSGSDLGKVTEQLGEELVKGADWCFAENGLYAMKAGEFLAKESFVGFLGEE